MNVQVSCLLIHAFPLTHEKQGTRTTGFYSGLTGTSGWTIRQKLCTISDNESAGSTSGGLCIKTPEPKMVIDRLFPYFNNGHGHWATPEKDKRAVLIFTQNQPYPSLFEWHSSMTANMPSLLGFVKPETLLGVNTIGDNEKDVDNIAGDSMKTTHENKVKYRSATWNSDLKGIQAWAVPCRVSSLRLPHRAAASIPDITRKIFCSLNYGNI